MSGHFKVLVAGECYCDPVFCVRVRVYEATEEPAECGPAGTLIDEEYVCAPSENVPEHPRCEIPNALKLADPFPYRSFCSVAKVPDVDLWEITVRDILSVHEGADACAAVCGEEEPL